MLQVDKVDRVDKVDKESDSLEVTSDSKVAWPRRGFLPSAFCRLPFHGGREGARAKKSRSPEEATCCDYFKTN
jgi:hypothetical protein